VPLFFFALTLLCSYFSSRLLRTLLAYPAAPLFFFAQQMCTKKKIAHSRVSKKQDNGTKQKKVRAKKTLLRSWVSF